MFIHLTQMDGQTVLINTEHVTHVLPNRDNTNITLVTRAEIRVQESFEAVSKVLSLIATDTPQGRETKKAAPKD